MLEAAITTTSSRAANPSSSTSSWLSVWSFSPEMSLPRVAPTASSSSMKMIAGVSLRAWRNSRLIRAAPSPANISTNEEADWAKKVAFDSCATALASRVLPVPGGPCSRMPLRDARAELAEALGVAQELHDLAQLVLRLLDAGHVVPAHRPRGGGLDLLRLGARHEAQHPEQPEGDDAHEDDRQPQHGPVLDVVPGQAAAGAGRWGDLRDAERVAAVLAGEGEPGQVHAPAVGQGAARRGDDLAEVHARLVAGEVAGLLERDAVAALDERDGGDAVIAGQLDRLAAFRGATLRERVRSGA